MVHSKMSRLYKRRFDYEPSRYTVIYHAFGKHKTLSMASILIYITYYIRYYMKIIDGQKVGNMRLLFCG